MNMKKIFLGLFLVLVGAIAILWEGESTEGHVRYQISASHETVKKGDEVTVSFAIKSEEAMNSADAYVYYDDMILEYISADKDVFKGATGVLKLTDIFDKEEKEVSYHLTFKALEVGKATLKVQEMFIEDDEEVSEAANVATTVTVTENMSESKDATLESLDVFPGTLTPEFAKEVNSYNMIVDSETDEIVMSAIPSDEESVVKFIGNENLQAGENTVAVEVTSKSGITKTYTIFVNKQ